MGVDIFTAYNVKFDIEALRKTQDQINDKRFRMPNGMNIMCLMDIAQTKVINNDFHNWFKKQDKYLQNQFTTDNDNISYSAECVFRYWFDNYYYKEQHTALRDARMEWKLAVKMFERWEKEIKRDFINFVVNLGWKTVNKIPSSNKKSQMRKAKLEEFNSMKKQKLLKVISNKYLISKVAKSFDMKIIKAFDFDGTLFTAVGTYEKILI